MCVDYGGLSVSLEFLRKKRMEKKAKQEKKANDTICACKKYHTTGKKEKKKSLKSKSKNW